MKIRLYNERTAGMILALLRARNGRDHVIPGRARETLAWIEENKVEAVLDHNYWTVDFKYEEDATAFRLKFDL